MRFRLVGVVLMAWCALAGTSATASAAEPLAEWSKEGAYWTSTDCAARARVLLDKEWISNWKCSWDDRLGPPWDLWVDWIDD